MKLVVKTVLLFFLMTLLLMTFGGPMSLAVSPTANPVANFNGASGTLNSGAQNGIETVGAAALYWVRLVGFMVAAIILAVLGIQWFLANPQQKAQIKERMWGYIIGAILAFGGPTIFGWIAGAFTDVFK